MSIKHKNKKVIIVGLFVEIYSDRDAISLLAELRAL